MWASLILLQLAPKVLNLPKGQVGFYSSLPESKYCVNSVTYSFHLNALELVAFNSLPNNNFLDMTKLKAFAEDKINVTKQLKFILERIENSVGKGESTDYPHFLLFPQCFQKLSFPDVLKLGIVR